MLRNITTVLKNDNWSIQNITVDEDGNTSTGDHLSPAIYDPAHIKQIAAKFRTHIAGPHLMLNSTKIKYLEQIDQLLDSIKFDYVIDGLNMGYLHHKFFELKNIEKVLNTIHSRPIAPNKLTIKVLVILR